MTWLKENRPPAVGCTITRATLKRFDAALAHLNLTKADVLRQAIDKCIYAAENGEIVSPSERRDTMKFMRVRQVVEMVEVRVPEEKATWERTDGALISAIDALVNGNPKSGRAARPKPAVKSEPADHEKD